MTRASRQPVSYRLRAIARDLAGIADEIENLEKVLDATREKPVRHRGNHSGVGVAEAEAWLKAIDAVGGHRAMARGLGNVSHQAVSQWRRCPAEKLGEVERLTGLSRQYLRPDLFGD